MRFLSLLLILVLLASLIVLSTGAASACGGGFACGDGGREPIETLGDASWASALPSLVWPLDVHIT